MNLDLGETRFYYMFSQN